MAKIQVLFFKEGGDVVVPAHCFTPPKAKEGSDDKRSPLTRGTWVARWVKRQTLVQVMISQLWVQAPRWALCGQLGAWHLLQILCLPHSVPPLLMPCLSLSLSKLCRGTWVALSVESPISAQVMISQFLGSSPAHIRLCADGSEPGACFEFCLPLSLPLPQLHALSLSLCLNKH